MTVERAIEILNPDAAVVWKAYDGKDMERCDEACRMACVALNKQIPKKPIEKEVAGVSMNGFSMIGYKYKGQCPKCKLIVSQFLGNYCHHCGQALDWSD